MFNFSRNVVQNWQRDVDYSFNALNSIYLYPSQFEIMKRGLVLVHVVSLSWCKYCQRRNMGQYRRKCVKQVVSHWYYFQVWNYGALYGLLFLGIYNSWLWPPATFSVKPGAFTWVSDVQIQVKQKYFTHFIFELFEMSSVVWHRK